jgi:hypothetical protein
MVPPPAARRVEVRASNPRKTLTLALYYVSEDESSSGHFHAGQARTYQAVLMVRVLISATFRWLTSDENRANRINEIQRSWDRLSCRYCLLQGHGTIQNIIIHFLAGFSNQEEAALRNYRADFSWHGIGSAVIVPEGGPRSDEITIRSDATGDDAVAYFLDIANPADLSNTAAMTNHLDFLRRWVNTQLSENYTLRAV